MLEYDDYIYTGRLRKVCGILVNGGPIWTERSYVETDKHAARSSTEEKMYQDALDNMAIVVSRAISRYDVFIGKNHVRSARSSKAPGLHLRKEYSDEISNLLNARRYATGQQKKDLESCIRMCWACYQVDREDLNHGAT